MGRRMPRPAVEPWPGQPAQGQRPRLPRSPSTCPNPQEASPEKQPFLAKCQAGPSRKHRSPVPSSLVLLRNSSIGGHVGGGATALPTPPAAHTPTGGLGPPPPPAPGPAACLLCNLAGCPSGPSQGRFWRILGSQGSCHGRGPINSKPQEVQPATTKWSGLCAPKDTVSTAVVVKQPGQGDAMLSALITARLAECPPCHSPRTPRDAGKGSSWVAPASHRPIQCHPPGGGRAHYIQGPRGPGEGPGGGRGPSAEPWTRPPARTPLLGTGLGASLSRLEREVLGYRAPSPAPHPCTCVHTHARPHTGTGMPVHIW